jgi:hypothetical protein
MTSATTSAAEGLATAIQTSWAAQLERRRRPTSPHRHVYASAWRPCTRRMVLELTSPDQLPPVSVDTLAKFQRGDDRERELLIDLMRVGRESDPPFTVMGTQRRFELKDHKGRVAIAGKVDAQLRYRAEDVQREVPVEVKSWSPYLTDRIRTYADLFDNPWTRSGAHQLLAYLFGAGEAFGFLLLDRPGLPLLLPVELEPYFDRVEDFLTRAEVALDHRDAGTLPPFLEGDAPECGRCGFFGSTCNPPTTYDAAQVLTDPELETLLVQREAVRTAGQEYERLDKQVKARLRGVERGVAGSFYIRGTWGKQSHVELPPALKAQYTVTDPRGRFTLDITKIA